MKVLFGILLTVVILFGAQGKIADVCYSFGYATSHATEKFYYTDIVRSTYTSEDYIRGTGASLEMYDVKGETFCNHLRISNNDNDAERKALKRLRHWKEYSRGTLSINYLLGFSMPSDR